VAFIPSRRLISPKLYKANAEVSFTVDQDSANTNIFSDNFSVTANTDLKGANTNVFGDNLNVTANAQLKGANTDILGSNLLVTSSAKFLGANTDILSDGILLSGNTVLSGANVDITGTLDVTGAVRASSFALPGGAPVPGTGTGGGSDIIFYESANTAFTDYTISTDKNAMAAGPLTIDTGVTITVPSGSRLVVV